MAARLLTMNLLAPMTDQSAIQSRLDAITEIVGEEERSFALRESMAPLGNSKVDLDKLINQLLAPEPRVGAGEPSRTENKIGQLLSLDSTLKSLGPVRAALSGARSGLLRAIRAFISGNSQLDEIMDLCADSINPDLFLSGGSKSLSSRNARLYAIKAAHSPLLDVARETYKEVRRKRATQTPSLISLQNMGDIHDLARRYSESYKLDVSLKSAATGFSVRDVSLWPECH
jgi:DNA mismatch repair protein MSH4